MYDGVGVNDGGGGYFSGSYVDRDTHALISIS